MERVFDLFIAPAIWPWPDAAQFSLVEGEVPSLRSCGETPGLPDHRTRAGTEWFRSCSSPRRRGPAHAWPMGRLPDPAVPLDLAYGGGVEEAIEDGRRLPLNGKYLPRSSKPMVTVEGRLDGAVR